MSWRGQGGRRAKGRRGDQDPELDNTAWLAELEREAAQADDDEEEDWARTLRGRRSPAPPPPTPAPQSPSDPGWAPPGDHRAPGARPGGAGSGYGPGSEGGGPGWAADPAPQDTASAPDLDSSWRPPAGDAFGRPAQTDADPGWDRYGETARPGPATDAFADPGRDARTGSGWGGPRADPDDWSDPGSGAGFHGAGDARGGDDPVGGWQPAGVDTPTGAWDPAEPVGREPDYPALFGELYRRSAAQQDPIWEAPPAAEPMPEQGPPDPPAPAWPFEETTQSWEPSDRSFIWPSDELPSTQADWDRSGSASWMDDPQPDQTAAWPGPGSRAWEEPAPEPAPEPRPSPWEGQPGTGVAPPTPWAGPPPPGQQLGPPPDDWASAIPTDVPAAERAADPSATQMWRPDEAEAEPGVPLRPGARRGRRPPREAPGGATDLSDAEARTSSMSAWEAADDPGAVRRQGPVDTGKARRDRPGGERQARAWPRVVAVISWIVLLMVLCWYYVFPWLERVLPENF
jgi:hypothetical protein